MCNMSDEYIQRRIRDFAWYAPVDFGNGIVARGDYLVETEPGSIDFGVGKWSYILERNLPNLQGKRVIDLGCNAGVFCVHMARLGATEVVGIDSEHHWPGWQEQANFVKGALEWRCKTRYPITYIDAELQDVPGLDLGDFDVALALCSIYYLEPPALEALVRYLSVHAGVLLLQCNTNKADQSPEVHRRAKPKFLAEVLRKCGYPQVWIDAPLLYTRPVAVGSHTARPWAKWKLLSKRGLRELVRRHV